MENRLQTEGTLTAIHRLDSLPPLSRQAQQLLSALGDPELDTRQLVLLHSLGLLALVHVAPQQMQRILLAADSADEEPLSILELKWLGLDHCRAGQQLATSWELPQEITDVMAFHRNSYYQGRHWELVTLTALAERRCADIESADALPEQELYQLLGRLGIEPAIWQQLLTDWQPKARNIAELARQFR